MGVVLPCTVLHHGSHHEGSNEGEGQACQICSLQWQESKDRERLDKGFFDQEQTGEAREQEGVSKWKEEIRQHQEVGRGSSKGSQGSRRHWLLCYWRQDGTGQGALCQGQGVDVGKASGSAEEECLSQHLRYICTWTFHVALCVSRRPLVGKFVHVSFPCSCH